ncbi:MAG: hypothetical protein ACYSX0_21690 [Planctomycetota bacterium]|jgi:hypothetical protein
MPTDLLHVLRTFPTRAACTLVAVEDPIELLQQALDAPDTCLGTVERNTEIKTIYFALWALGWNPVRDIALGFHIPRTKLGEGAKAAHAADFALRDSVGLCAIGEAKHWFVGERAWDNALPQIQRYQRAIKTPRAFLSCGRWWLVLNEDGTPTLAGC